MDIIIPREAELSLFGDSTRWAIVFEKTAFNNRAGATVIELHYFGNCLSNLDKAGSDNQFTCNTKWIDLISGEELEGISADFELVAKSARTVKVRNTPVAIEQDLAKYRHKGIQIYEHDNPEELVDFVALTRYLDEENRELFRATDEELRTCIPEDLPRIMIIDQWHHKEYGYYECQIIGTKPSDYETCQLISEILVTKDITKWKPTLEPTNDWRHWPQAGGL